MNNVLTRLKVNKSNKTINLLGYTYEDLKIHLHNEQDYVLLVDDANRQLLNFKQILGVFKENRKGNIKLVVTVRDYALNDILNECLDFLHEVITLKKFTDEEVTQIISSDSFEIKHYKYQKRIVEINLPKRRPYISPFKMRLPKHKGKDKDSNYDEDNLKKYGYVFFHRFFYW